MKLLQQQVFRFEGIEIDRSQGCLKIGGQERYHPAETFADIGLSDRAETPRGQQE